MTDNEIIKALECHKFAYDPYMQSVIEQTLSLINRQKAEIEELTKLLRSRHIAIEFLEGVIVGLPDEVRAEAAKEFAERLRYALIINNEHNTIAFDYDFTLETIDNLVKEMVGDSDEN